MEQGDKDILKVLRSIASMYNIDDLDPNVEYDYDTLRMFKEKIQPTEEDVKRQLIEEEIKELCIKVKCRVDAYRWNPVNDCSHEFSDESNDETDGEYNSAELLRRGGDKESCALFEANTESMTLVDSNESISSKGQQSDMQSQDLLITNYDDFGTGVPLTSTQSHEDLESKMVQ